MGRAYHQGELFINTIKALLPTYKHFLSELVKIHSVYGQEKEAQLLVKSKMEELGLVVNTYNSRSDEASMNLVSVIHGTDNRYKSLILNAHCDVAAVDADRRWTKKPFSGEIVDNTLYGRGSLDDKAGIAVILLIVNVLKNSNILLKGDLIIESVIEDETTGNGSKILVEKGYVADGVIIVDGTWPERIIYAHLGQVWIDVEIMGEPVAACVESRGVNPIYIGIELIKGLKDFIAELNSSGETFVNIEKPYFMNVGSFHSGVWPGSVPAEAKLEIQIGFPYRFSPDEIIAKVNEIARAISDKIQIKATRLKTPPYAADKDNSLIPKLKSIIEANSVKEVLTVAVTGHADMRHFPTKNICLYGPGGGKSPHGLDEHYFLEHMPVVANNLIEFVLDWCNEIR